MDMEFMLGFDVALGEGDTGACPIMEMTLARNSFNVPIPNSHLKKRGLSEMIRAIVAIVLGRRNLRKEFLESPHF
jgi:hypothetical protein